VRGLDSTFRLDFANGGSWAPSRIDEGLAIPPPALTEFFEEAFPQAGPRVPRVLELIAELEILEVTEPLAVEAARLREECSRREEPVGALD
jgi:hypothetical protein